MSVTKRPPAGDADLARIDDLLRSAAPATRHLVDMPWRLSTEAFQNGEDVRLWQDGSGNLLAFAAWQQWWAVLDYVIRPGIEAAAIEDGIFAWALERFRALDRTRGRPLPYWIEARDDDTDRLANLARHGYDLHDDDAYVYLRRPLHGAIPAPTLPAGYAIRPLAGEREVTSYVALHRAAFASAAMTVKWRLRTLRMPRYIPELDLVAVAPDGALVGFCVCWLDAERRLGQIEPLGVHPAHQRSGLAHALLMEAFARLRSHGAESALVETDKDRLPARRTYAAAGFEVAHTVHRKGRYVG